MLLLVLQGQLYPIGAFLSFLPAQGPAGSDEDLLVLAGSDSAAAGAAAPPGAGPPVARPAGRGGGAGVASRYVNTMPTSQLQGGGMRSAWACFQEPRLLHEGLWVLSGWTSKRADFMHRPAWAVVCCSCDTCWCSLSLYSSSSCNSYCPAGPLPSLVLAQQCHLAPGLQRCSDLPQAQPLALRPMPGQLRLSAATAEEGAPHLMPRLAPRLGTVKLSDHTLRESVYCLHKPDSLTALHESHIVILSMSASLPSLEIQVYAA